jgi:hypothetical protein
MVNKITLLSAVLLVLIIGACKKSNSGGGNNLTGTTWNFTSLTSNGNITASESVLGQTIKIVDVADFTTIKNTGTIAFTADSMEAIGVGYTIDTTYTTYDYVGSTIDTVVTPLQTAVAPTNSSAGYKLIGSDSIYFENGSSPFSVSLYAGDTVQINGAHYSISGNTLTLTSTLTQTQSIDTLGTSIPAIALVKSTIILTK